jgi:hypothetical protein
MHTRWAGHEVHKAEIMIVIFFLEKMMEKLRHRWQDNIKMDFKGILCKDVDRIQHTQDRV